jgi:hypothetical protein
MKNAIYCSHCGAPIAESVNFCASCGNAAPSAQEPATPVKSNTKYWFVLIPLSLVVWAFTAIQNEVRGPVSITVEASSGFPVQLRGTCETVHDGVSGSEDFSGTTPFNKTFMGPVVISCIVQNQSDRAEFYKVWIKSNEDTVARGETSNPYGVVSVAAHIR